MSSIAQPMATTWIWQKVAASNKKTEMVASDRAHFKLESTKDAIGWVKKYFSGFDFNLETIDNQIEETKSLSVIDSEIASFLVQKTRIFESKLPGFSQERFLYKFDSNGKKVTDKDWRFVKNTFWESIEYLRRLLRIEITKRKNEDRKDFDDLIQFIEYNFLSHYTYLLEKRNTTYKDKLTSYFFSRRNQNIPSVANGRNQSQFARKQELIPDEQMKYLRDTISSILEYNRNSIEYYRSKLRFELLWDDVVTELTYRPEPRMIRMPYLEKSSTFQLGTKVKESFRSIFTRK